MSYKTNGDNFISLELERHIRLLHKAVNNAVTDRRFILFGTGSTQLLNALVYALSPDDSSSSPARVVASVPYYPVDHTNISDFAALLSHKNTNTSGNIDNLAAGFYTAFAFSEFYSGPFVQVFGDILLWNQHVEHSDYSANVIGCFKRDDANKVAVMLLVGYGVYPSKFGDNKNRLFIASTVYDTNCDNDAACLGFVPIPSKYKFGGTIEDTSVYGDPNNQKALKVSIRREDSKWCILYNGEKMGYIKDEDLGYITNCDEIGWGGIVGISGTASNPTQMGNGHLPSEGYSRTGAFASTYGLKLDGNLTTGGNYAITIDRPLCYNMEVDQKNDPRYTFLYGGHGC